NLSKSRVRSDQESLIITRLIWQSTFGDGESPSQRFLARQLGVWPSYVCKLRKQSEEGLEMFTRGYRVTLDDLDKERRITAKLRQQEPGLLRAVQSSRSEKHSAVTVRKCQAQAERVATIPGRPVLEGHGWNCDCVGCRVKAEMDAAIRAAR